MQPMTHFAAESSSGIGALGFDGKAFLIQLFTFVLAFLVLKRYVFKPILNVMEERRKTIEEGVKLGELMRREQAAFEDKMAELLKEARQQADGIVGTAQDDARQTIREAEDKARAKAAVILAEAESRIETDIVRARQKLKGELVSLVSEATEAIIDEKIDPHKDTQLIEKALKRQTGRQAA